MLSTGEHIAALGEDNSIRIYQLNGELITTIYPPPTANDVKEVHYSKELNKFIVLLENGSICIFPA